MFSKCNEFIAKVARVQVTINGGRVRGINSNNPRLSFEAHSAFVNKFVGVVFCACYEWRLWLNFRRFSHDDSINLWPM